MSSVEQTVTSPLVDTAGADRKARRSYANKFESRHRRAQSNTYSTLMVLEAACRLRNYGKAALEVGLTRSAVSMAIARLEKMLGSPLFVQSGREMIPTLAAEQLCAGFLASRLQLDRALSSASRQSGSTIVSLPRSLSYRWLGRRLGAMCEALGPLQIIVHEDDAHLDYNGIDVAITTHASHMDGVQTELLFDETLEVAASPDLAARIAKETPGRYGGTFIELAVWPVSLWEKTSGVRWCENATIVRLTDFDVALDAVLSGFGATLIPQTILNDFVKTGELTVMHHSNVPSGRRFYMHWNRGITEDKTRPIRRWLRHQFCMPTSVLNIDDQKI